MNTCDATVVLGGGGHTKEMVEILKVSPVALGSINVVYSSCDAHSLDVFKKEVTCREIRAFQVPRPNKVLSGYSIVQMLRSLLACMHTAWMVGGDVLLCNGPGVCVPFCLGYKLAHPWTSVVYVESVTRSKTLSLSGKILQYFADVFIVQSKQLERLSFPKRTYCNVFLFKK
ncbi:beta-1,4-N-acetylglucosaminyltransferase [Nematocida sp. AWRm77]|nr:beta-1,4-N-acetylglucosaminyltransferase [Nematocida sp. AWRm77]